MPTAASKSLSSLLSLYWCKYLWLVAGWSQDDCKRSGWALTITSWSLRRYSLCYPCGWNTTDPPQIVTVTLCGLAIALPRITGVSNWSLQHFSNDNTVGKASIAWLVLYGASVALSKLAILLLYLRVFTTQWYGFTLVLILISIVVIGTGVTNAFAAIFQCSPVSYTWDKTVEDGKCLNNLAFARFMAIPNVVDGFVMLAMPIPLVWQLNLAIQQKVALTATFLHGITWVVCYRASCWSFIHSQHSS